MTNSDLLNLNPALILIQKQTQFKIYYDYIDEAAEEEGVSERVVTSLNDGDHMPGSHHDTGNAVDLRGKDLTDELQDSLADRIRDKIGPEYDVVSEKFPAYPDWDHIHIEYDPPADMQGPGCHP